MSRKPRIRSLYRFRHEWKYYINEGEQALLRERLKCLTRPDEHVGEQGEYKIRSLYFDNYWSGAYQDKVEGVNNRVKYRIRIYNDSDKTINLERKMKQGNYIHKDSASLTRDQCEAILRGEYGFLLRHPEQLAREFYYECTTNLMRPRVIVDYDREPLTLDAGTVRVTFDKRLRAAMLGFDLFDPLLPTLSASPPGKTILEVKFTEFLPTVIRQALPPGSGELTAISKFIMCCDAVGYMIPAGSRG